MPHNYEQIRQDWQRNFHEYYASYESHHCSFVPYLLPDLAVQLNIFQVFEVLRLRLGLETLKTCIDPSQTVASPVEGQPDGSWLKKTNMVGINVRTIGNFFNVVQYALTLGQTHDSIHLLPIWEPGVVGSLYGKVSWNINPAFFSVELQRIAPALDTVEKQLKVVVNLLHAMGKTVGLDVIPHTDRFSEMVLLHPRYFEWVRRDHNKIADHRANVHQEVEEEIWRFLNHHGPADGSAINYGKAVFFDASVPLLTDKQRHEILFGRPQDPQTRLRRRIDLMQYLIYLGYETLPMTMAPPYRGLHIDPDNFVIDERGTRWYTYQFDAPQGMSRVFGPLARYRFWEAKDDNQHWEIDFDKPNLPVWQYVAKQYLNCQRTYNFDFMRGDMAHVQMRPQGVPAQPGQYYDPLRFIKTYIQRAGARHFAFFGETFLAPPNVMAYGNEPDHLEAIRADSTLGDLQGMVVGSEGFMRAFSDYYTYSKNRSFAPNFTVITADKDDPRFDEFYQTGNVARYFISLFLTDMPSYTALGFEQRALNTTRNANETYSKLYVFEIGDDAQTDKVTHAPYQWGRNGTQFSELTRIKLFAENIWEHIAGRDVVWLIPIDATAQNKLIAWQIQNPELGGETYTFIVNLDTQRALEIPESVGGTPLFCTDKTDSRPRTIGAGQGKVFE